MLIPYKVTEETDRSHRLEEENKNLLKRLQKIENSKISDLIESTEDKIKELEIENLELKYNLQNKEDVYNNLSVQYENYNKHISKLCEDIYIPNTTPLELDRNISARTISKESFSDDFVTDLIVDSLFNSFLLENSIDLQKINDKILNNYSLFLNTIFQRNDNNFSSTIVHEYMEDLYFRIYDFYLKKILKNINEVNYDIWEITQDHITDNYIDLVAQDVFNNNVINLICKFSNNNDLNSFDKIKENFYTKFKSFFDFKDEKLFRDMIFNNEDKINQKLNYLLMKHKEKSIIQIRNIIIMCKNNIFSGKIIEKGNVVYNYKKFYIEYLNLEKQHYDSSFNFINNLDSQDIVDNLTNSIKYKKAPLKSIYISTNTNGKIEYSLSKLVQSILLFNPELKYFTLTEVTMLSTYQVQNIVKLIDYTTIEVLDLSNNKMGDSSFRLICDSLKNNQSIKILYLSNNNLTSIGASYLSDLFIKNKTIEKVNLGGNKIIDFGLQSMINSLCTNTNIKHLDISDNKLSHIDLLYISNHLISKNQSIEVLNLSNNRFDPESVNVFGLSLRNNNTLKILYLNSASLNEDSSPYFFQNLAGTKLSEIYLDNNYMNEIGGILFANVLKNNVNIKLISMKKCELNSMSLHCISKALEINETLKVMNLEENKFDDQSIFTLKNIINNRVIKISMTATCLTTRSFDLIRKSDNFVIY